MLTSFADDEALFAAVMAGAAGYLLKQMRGNDLVDAVRRVASGESLLDPGDHRRAWSGCAGPPGTSARRAHRAGAAHPRADRRGLTNRQIGERMYLAEKTVKNYVSNLLAKLGMERRTQAAVFATEHLP